VIGWAIAALVVVGVALAVGGYLAIEAVRRW